jgi:hypothetical protein
MLDVCYLLLICPVNAFLSLVLKRALNIKRAKIALKIQNKTI